MPKAKPAAKPASAATAAPVAAEKPTVDILAILKKQTKLSHLRLEEKEEEARETAEECEEEFDPIMQIIVPLMAACGKDETRITNLSKSVSDLRTEKLKLEDTVEELKEKHEGEMARLKADYEQRIHNMCDDISKQAAENDRLRKELSVVKQKGDAAEVITHVS